MLQDPDEQDSNNDDNANGDERAGGDDKEDDDDSHKKEQKEKEVEVKNIRRQSTDKQLQFMCFRHLNMQRRAHGCEGMNEERKKYVTRGFSNVLLTL